MRLQFSDLIRSELHAPGDTTSDATGHSDSEDTFELLNAEEPAEVLEIGKTESGDLTADEDEDEEKEEKEKEPEDELKELEEELKEPTEEDLELMTPVRRKEILSKYPKLFKDFPYLEKAYYREQQFTEVFPTIQDARASAEKAKVLDNIEQQVMSGDISNVLQAARQESQEAFLKIVDNYLPALRKADQQAYYHVLGNVIKDTIVTMVREGRALGDQGAPLQAAANVLNQFVFGSQKFTPAHQLSQQPRPEEQSKENELRVRERDQIMGHFETTRDDLQVRADNVLKSTIDQHIDPNRTMTDYVRNHATKEAFDTLETLISKDARFRGILDKMWERAFERRFDKESTDRIKSAYLSKAKTLLPSVIKKARNDALRGLGRRASSDGDENRPSSSQKRGPIQPGKSTSPSSGKIRKPSDIPKGMSTLDVLMKD